MAMPEHQTVVERLKHTPKGKLHYNSRYCLKSPPASSSHNSNRLVVSLPLSSPPKSAANRNTISPLIAIENSRNAKDTEALKHGFESRRKSDSSVQLLDKKTKPRQEPLHASNSDIAGLLVFHEMQAKKHVKAEGKQRKNEFIDGVLRIKQQSEYLIEGLNSKNNAKYINEVNTIDFQQETIINERKSLNDLKNRNNQRAILASENQKAIKILKEEILAKTAALEEMKKENIELSRKLETTAVMARDLFKSIENLLKSYFDNSTLTDNARDIHGKALNEYKQAIDVVKNAVANQEGLKEACIYTIDTAESLNILKEKLSEEITRIENEKKEEQEKKAAEQKKNEEIIKLEEENSKAQQAAMPSTNNNNVTSSVTTAQSAYLSQENITNNFVSPSALIIYNETLKFQQDVSNSYADLVDSKNGDANMLDLKKKYRFNLSKVINTPINAISDQSAAHLIDKIDRLTKLLNGHAVELGGKTISAKDHPSGLAYCKDSVAKKLVLQGARQISSSFNSAFAIASVALGIWAQLPEMGKLIMAHLYTACPYLVPYYIPKKQEQSIEEYLKILGYEVDGKSIESDEKYLKKLSGIVRLYAAIVQSPMPPHLASVAHPHGIHNGWTWLVRLLNLEPRKTVTATVIFDFLEVAGHALYKSYGKQFQKLLQLLCTDVMPKIDLLTPADEKGPVVRLKSFLEKCIQTGSIPIPEGYLSPRWWRQRTF